MATESTWKRLYERERTAKLICAELNQFVDLKSVLLVVLKRLRDMSGCEAVAMRLHDEGDYPYYVYEGFPESFIEKENSLCAKDESGEPVANPDGPGCVLECMCGNVIRGRFDPELPFFTPGGSFWSNHTSQLLASTTEAERQADTRNHCNSCGYESVALVPVKARGDTMGLLQFNDHRRDLFTAELIEYLEMIGEQIGLAVSSSLTYEKLKRALEEAKVLRGLIPICACCRKVRDDGGYWRSVETYVRDHSEADFTHTYCPECFEKEIAQFATRPDRTSGGGTEAEEGPN